MTPSIANDAAVAKWLEGEVRAGRLPRHLSPESEARIAAVLVAVPVVSSQKKTAGRAGLRQAAQKEVTVAAATSR